MNNKIAISLASLAVIAASVCAAEVTAQEDIPLFNTGGGNGTADVPVNSWTGLQYAIYAYEQGQVIVVTQDLSCDNDRCISVGNYGTAVIDLDGHVLDRGLSSSKSKGSVISVSNGGNLTVKDSKGTGAITGGWSDGNGGGICVSAGAFCSVEGVTVSGNVQDGNGGGIYAEGCLTVKDSVIEGNIAKGNGGAVYVQTSCYDLVMGGMITATDNEASVGNGVYMLSGTFIRFDGAPADGSAVRILTETDPYVFTSGLSGTDPQDLFVTDYGYTVGALGGEAVLARGHGWQIEDGQFIGWKDYVNPDYYSITGANWMSGVSGERYLNEINVPETHNSCTQDVSGFGPTVEWGPEYYETQKRFARQLMEEGVRCFDLRLINWYYDEDKKHFDDGHTLWIGHGKDYDSYHMALDERGNMISFDMLLNWVMQFLTDNPSEMIILDLAPEVDKEKHQADYQLVLERTRDYLQRYDSRINPSTGEKFLYSEDGTYGEPYTFVPKLKDCRGKIFITCGSGNVDILGGMVYNKFLHVHSVKDGQSVGPEKRVENIMEVYNQYCKGLLPEDAQTHLDDLNKISINCTSKKIGTPMEVEAIVFDDIFNTKHLLDQRGIYYGFWRGDAITAWEANYLWRTNYSDHLQYRTVTVQSVIEGIPDQTFILLKGTKITIPGCIYSDEPAESFYGWRADGRIYTEGQEYEVDSDVTFSAVWKYKVSFDMQGHGTGPAEQTVEYGGKVAKPADPVAEHYIFGGWFRERACTAAWDFDKDTVSGDTMLYAKWTVECQVRIEQGQNGTVDNKGTFRIAYGEAVNIAGNTMTIGEYRFTATPDGPSETVAYSFFGWVYENGVPPAKVTGDMVITGVFLATVTPVTDDRGNTTVDARAVGDSPVRAEIPAGTRTLDVEGWDYSVYIRDTSDLAGRTVTVAVEKVDNPSSEIAGDAYEFTITQNGASYTGKMSVTLPYEPVEGKKAAVYFIDGGDAVKMKVTGYGGDGVTFETDHNSVYVVSYEDREPDSGGSEQALLFAAVVIALIAVISIAFFISRNRF